jgi:hypothetical protein
MTQAERERRHQANLDRINDVQVVVGRGDRARIDHEGTLLERARLYEEEIAAHQATERGLAALDRLLLVAAERRSAAARDVVAFINAVRDHEPLPLSGLRGQQASTGDDMLAVLDAFRHARLDLVESVKGGARRVANVLDAARATSG